MDDVAPELRQPVVAQIGAGRYIPRHLDWKRTFTAGAFDALIPSVTTIVSHAGIGTILAAQRFGKPVIILPRRAKLGEHRNDHQVSTVTALRGRKGIYIAQNAADIRRLLGITLAPCDINEKKPGRDNLVNELRRIIAGI
jgi:UDP-N-acetylglucosamine transferase subunit ALG13